MNLKRIFKVILSIFLMGIITGIIIYCFFTNKTVIADIVNEYDNIMINIANQTNSPDTIDNSVNGILHDSNSNISTRFIGKTFVISHVTDASMDGYSSKNKNRFRHIWCVEWAEAHSMNDFKILDVINVGFSDFNSSQYGTSDNPGYKLENPKYVNAIKSSKSSKIDETDRALFIAYKAYQTTIDTNVTFGDYALDWIKTLGNDILDASDANKFNSSSGLMGEGQSSKWVSWNGGQWVSINPKTCSVSDAINLVNKNILVSETNISNVKASNSVQVSGTMVGPFQLLFGTNTSVTYTSSANTKIHYTGDDGSDVIATTIPKNKEFYIEFTSTDSIPDSITFNNSYDQYVARLLLVYGGYDQSRWIATGENVKHKSSVTFEIEKNADVKMDTYITSVVSTKDTPTPTYGDTRKEQSNSWKKDTSKVYVETGDTINVRLRETNNDSLEAKLNVVNTNFDSGLGYVDGGSDRTPWNGSNNQYTIGSAQSPVKNPIKQNNPATQTLRLTMDDVQESTVKDTVYEINGNFDKDDVDPEDSDETNNSSSDYVRLKSIGANIKKDVVTQSAYGLTPGGAMEGGKWKVEYGDYVQYAIEVTNPGKNDGTASALYDIEFTEDIPDGLELSGIYRISGNTKYNVGEVTNPISAKINSAQKTIDLKINKISPQSGYKIIFEYKVTSFGSENETEQAIVNTVTLDKYYNRNNWEFDVDQKDTAVIYVKTYRIDVNKYLSKVSYGTNGTEIPNPSRQGFSETEKDNNPYYVEYGDTLEFKLDITNNGGTDLYNIQFYDVFDKDKLSYLPKQSGVEDNDVFIASTSTYNNQSRIRFYRTSSHLEKGKKFTIVLRFKVIKTLEYDDIVDIYNSMIITQVKNKNNEFVISRTLANLDNGVVHAYGTLTSTEHVRERTYSLTTNKYISGYDGKVMYENINNNLITLSDESADYYDGYLAKFIGARRNLSNQEKFDKPFAVEKTETVKYTVRIENQKNEDEQNDATMYVDQVYDFVDQGLSIQKDSVHVNVKQSDFRQLIEPTDYQVTVNSTANAEDKITIQFKTETITTENRTQKQVIALEPGDYIEITYDVLVTESNMTLEKLMNTAYVREAFNRNSKVIFELTGSGNSTSGTVTIDGGNGSGTGSFIISDTGLNTSSVISIEVVKLKEVVVAGYVWNDTDKNGIKHRSEPGIPDILVTLNGLTDSSKDNRYTQVTTNKDGLFTFGRVFRTDKFERYENSMYISYTYDGVVYQSSLYSGVNNLTNQNGAWFISEGDKYKVDSNAKEFMDSRDGFTGRTDFNDELKTISYNYATSDTEDGNQGDLYTGEYEENLQYEKRGTISTRINTDGSTRFMESYSFIMAEEVQAEDEEGNPMFDEDGEPIMEIHEYIEPLWFENVRSADYDTEYLKFINLGLISRDKLDLSIDEELVSVQTTIFGDQMKYLYEEDDEPVFQFYEGDYDYEYTDYLNDAVHKYLTSDSELTTEVTYKVTLTNGDEGSIINDANVAVEVNELALYLDNKYLTYATGYFDNTGYHRGLVNTILVRKENEDGLFDDISISTLEAYYYDNAGNKVNLAIYPEDFYGGSNFSPYERRESHDLGYTRFYLRPWSNEDSGFVIPNSTYDDVLGKRVPGTFDIYLKFTDANRSDSRNANRLGNCKIELNQKYNNVVEISAYSTYYKNDKDYGFGSAKELQRAGHGAGYIDIDSNPGNIGLTDSGEFINFFVTDQSEEGIDGYSNYAEDDTCRGEILFKGGSGSGSGTGDGDGNGGGGSGTGDGNGNGGGSGTGTGDGDEPLLRTINGIVFEDARSEAVMDKVTGKVNNGLSPYSTLYVSDEEREKVLDAINKDVTDEDYAVDSDGNVYKNVQYIGNGLYNRSGSYNEPDESSDTALQNARTNKVTELGRFSSYAQATINLFHSRNFGKYDYLLSGINVSLFKTIKLSDDLYYEVDLSDENEYNQGKLSDSRKVSTVTSNNRDTRGEYTLDVSTPGNYFVRFNYGNGEEVTLGVIDGEWEAEANQIVYNGQDYKSTTLANYDEYLKVDRLRSDNSRVLDNDQRKILEGSWIIEILNKWLVQYYNYSSDDEWYRAMLEEYNEQYHFLEGKTGNSFMTLPSYYLRAYGDDYDYSTNYTYVFIMETIYKDIGKDPNSDNLSFRTTLPNTPGATTGAQIVVTPYTLMQWLLPNDKLEKAFRNAMFDYIQKEGSVAMDDARQRMILLDRSKEMNNTTAEVLASFVKYVSTYNKSSGQASSELYKLGEIEAEYKELLDIFTKYSNMIADSSEFYLRTEKIKYDYTQMDENEVQYIKYKDRFDVDELGIKKSKYNVENIDCGLQYRPETELRLKEYVKEIKVVTSTGETWIDIKFNEDKSINTEYENKGLSNMMRVESIRIDNPETGGYEYQKGFEFINVDEIYLQGSTLYIDYGIYVDNTSEIDRIGVRLDEFDGDGDENAVQKALDHYNMNVYIDQSQYYFVKVFSNYAKKFGNKYTNFRDWYDEFYRILMEEYYIGSFKDIDKLIDWHKYEEEVDSIDSEAWMLKQFLQETLMLVHRSSSSIFNKVSEENISELLDNYSIYDEHRSEVNDILRRIMASYSRASQITNGSMPNSSVYDWPTKILTEQEEKEALYYIIGDVQKLEEVTSNLRTVQKNRNYYSDYLGTNFYGGKGGGNIVGVKVDQIVSDIDPEIMVDNTVNSDWNVLGMEDVVHNNDAYFFFEDYDLNEDEVVFNSELLLSEAELAELGLNDEFNEFAKEVLSSVISSIKLYSAYENVYDELAFSEWYKKAPKFIHNTTKANKFHTADMYNYKLTNDTNNGIAKEIYNIFHLYDGWKSAGRFIIDQEKGVNGYGILSAYFKYKADESEEYEDKMNYLLLSEILKSTYLYDNVEISGYDSLIGVSSDEKMYKTMITYVKAMEKNEALEIWDVFDADKDSEDEDFDEDIDNLATIPDNDIYGVIDGEFGWFQNSGRSTFSKRYSEEFKSIIEYNLNKFIRENSEYKYNRTSDSDEYVTENDDITKAVSVKQDSVRFINTRYYNKVATFEDYNTLCNIIYPNQTYDRNGDQYIDTYVRDENGNVVQDENGNAVMNIPENTRVSTSILTQRVISGDILQHADLKFNNYSEILNYTATNGRKTVYSVTVGNGIHGEVDDDESVEYVTFSNPTGLPIYQQKLRKVRTGMIWAVVAGISILVISGIGMLIANKKGKKKYWR